jgi:hypothetical protein
MAARKGEDSGNKMQINTKGFNKESPESSGRVFVNSITLPICLAISKAHLKDFTSKSDVLGKAAMLTTEARICTQDAPDSCIQPVK